jgi:hypothetical protein
MKQIFNLILELRELRNETPHFLFLGDINFDSLRETRKNVLSFKKSNPDCKEIDLIIQSPGGLPHDAYRIIKTFRKSFEEVNIIIPFWAKSAATLMSLGGTRIIMDQMGEFGPLDAQLVKERDDSPEYDRESALNDEYSLGIIESRFKEMYESIFIMIYEHEQINIPKIELSRQVLENVARFYEPLLAQINPYKLGEKRRILQIGAQYAHKILSQFVERKSESKFDDLVEFLVNECPDHGYIIDFDSMKHFLDHVYSSAYFGREYANKLTELTTALMNMDEEYNYLNFVRHKQ